MRDTIKDFLLGAAIVAVLCILLAIADNAKAGDWTGEDTAREAVYFGLLYVDYRQTLYGSRHPDTFHESNPLLPSHPTDVEIRNAVAASAMAHAAVAYMLPPQWREVWQYLFIGGEIYATSHNYSVGIHVPF